MKTELYEITRTVNVPCYMIGDLRKPVEKHGLVSRVRRKLRKDGKGTKFLALFYPDDNSRPVNVSLSHCFLRGEDGTVTNGVPAQFRNRFLMLQKE